MEAVLPVGIYRIKDGFVVEDSVRVRYPDGKEIEIPASQYALEGYEPPLDDLEQRDDS